MLSLVSGTVQFQYRELVQLHIYMYFFQALFPFSQPLFLSTYHVLTLCLMPEKTVTSETDGVPVLMVLIL